MGAPPPTARDRRSPWPYPPASPSANHTHWPRRRRTCAAKFGRKDKGGPEVVNAMLGALDSYGPAKALEAGVKEVGKIIKAQDRHC